jgi:periplasmic protein TonB
VALQIEIDSSGNVSPESVKVIAGLNADLDQKAVDAVKQWKFKPGLKNGKAVAVPATIRVNFEYY